MEWDLEKLVTRDRAFSVFLNSFLFLLEEVDKISSIVIPE